MKLHFTKKFTLLLCLVGLTAFAKAAVTGPSDATSAPPVHASDVGQVVCYGAPISLKGPTDPGSSYKKYEWYKIDAGGNKVLVKDGTAADKDYTEASDGAGYYIYQLVILNTNDCSSDISDPFKVYVLPQLNVTIAPTGNVTSVCEKGQSTTTLTANVTNPNANIVYTYQWQRNGADIAGATTNTYLVTEANSGSVDFGVKVSYVLDSGCTQTASQTITVVPVPVKPVIVSGP
jgi:hypothetical protein